MHRCSLECRAQGRPQPSNGAACLPCHSRPPANKRADGQSSATRQEVSTSKRQGRTPSSDWLDSPVSHLLGERLQQGCNLLAEGQSAAQGYLLPTPSSSCSACTLSFQSLSGCRAVLIERRACSCPPRACRSSPVCPVHGTLPVLATTSGRSPLPRVSGGLVAARWWSLAQAVDDRLPSCDVLPCTHICKVEQRQLSPAVPQLSERGFKGWSSAVGAQAPLSRVGTSLQLPGTGEQSLTR